MAVQFLDHIFEDRRRVRRAGSEDDVFKARCGRLEARLRRRGRGAAAIAPRPPVLLAHGGLMALKTLYSPFRNHAEKT